MVNEAVIVELNPNKKPVNFTCASGTAITKGSILKNADPRTASLSAAKFDIVAGIAAADKAADDYSTTIAVYTPGSGHIFDLVVGTETVNVGDRVATSGANFIIPMSAGTCSGSSVIGIALETASAGETIEVLV